MSVVSVIIPCYNYGRFLRDCVESVLTQEGVDVRVLILDDCSPDDTPEVASRLAAEDSRVEYRRHAENKRHIATYNEGIEWADGDYTLLLSADDLLAPDALRRAVNVFDSNADVGLVYGRALRCVDGVPELGSQAGTFRVYTGADWLLERCIDGGNCIYSPEAIARTSLLQQLGGYVYELPHTADLDLWMRLSVHGHVAKLDAVQAFYRVHGQNMHVQHFSAVIADLEQRRAAFDHVFASETDRIADVDNLRLLAYRALAGDALWAACRSYDEGRNRHMPVEELVMLAERICPDAHGMNEYASLRLRQRLGPSLWRVIHALRSRRSIAW